MNIPFDKIEMLIALGTVSKKLTKEKMDKVREELRAVTPKSQKEVVEGAAKANKMPLDKFMKDPRAKAMCADFIESKVKEGIKIMMRVLGISEVEAWAVQMQSEDLL